MKESDTKCYTSVDLEKVVAWQTIGNDEPMDITVTKWKVMISAIFFPDKYTIKYSYHEQ